LEENLTIYYLALVLSLGIAAQWIAWRLRLPSILLLLGFGFALGQITADDGDRLFDPDTLIGGHLLMSVVALSVATILFEGGMTLKLAELRQAGRVVLRLVTLGAAITWALTAAAAMMFLEFDHRLAALVGAILVVTGPTVIGPLLRHVRPSRKIGSIVKWEGIVIDPIGAVLAVLVLEVAFAGGVAEAAGSLLQTIVIGGGVGLAAAVVLVVLLKRYWVPDFLHIPVVLSTVLAAFTVSNHFQSESGLLTVTVLGIAMANQHWVPIRHVLEFKENLRVLLISCLFIVLASRLHLGDLTGLGGGAIAFLIALVLVVRPAAIFLCTLGTKLNRSERLFLAFLAPRGIVAAAVASVFALEVAHRGGDALAEQANALVPLTFLVIVGTVTIYGLAAAPLARWLGLADSDPQGILFLGADPWIRELASAVQEEGHDVMLVDTNHRNIAAARLAGLPTYVGNILSEQAHEEIDLGGIGRLLAMTANDEVNSLACLELTETFGSRNVYQLAVRDGDQPTHSATPGHLRGRSLFASEATHDQITLRLAFGAQFKKTTITEEFTYDDFLQRYGETAIPLLWLSTTGTLSICTADGPVEPQTFQKLLALVDSPPSDPAP
jgi:NhaP-type Na+/H+ or K+/H+ antiporter